MFTDLTELFVIRWCVHMQWRWCVQEHACEWPWWSLCLRCDCQAL